MLLYIHTINKDKRGNLWLCVNTIVIHVANVLLYAERYQGNDIFQQVMNEK